MKNFIQRVLENKMNGKDVAVLVTVIMSFIILIGVLLNSMGVHIPKD